MDTFGMEFSSEEEVNVEDFNEFFSIHDIENIMPEVQEGWYTGLPMPPHAAWHTSGTLLRAHVAISGVFKEMAYSSLNHHPGRLDRSGRRGFPSEALQTLVANWRDRIIASLYLVEGMAFIIPPAGEEVVKVGAGDGKYVFVFQVLLGDHNLDFGFPVGVTYGILQRPARSGELVVEELDGNSMTGAGYFLMGCETVLVISYEPDQGSHEYFWDRAIGEFMLSRAELSVPRSHGAYTINEAFTLGWCEKTRTLLTRMKNTRLGKEGENMYIDSPVAEHHRINCEGGLYFNPIDQVHPTGRLPLIQVCWPLGYITRGAKGLGTDGDKPILQVRATSVDDTSPYYGGSWEDCIHFIHLSQAQKAHSGDKGHEEVPWSWRDNPRPARQANPPATPQISAYFPTSKNSSRSSRPL